MDGYQPEQKNKSLRRRQTSSPHIEYYVELPVEIENNEKTDMCVASPTRLNPLVKKLKIKRKHEEKGDDHTEESKRRNISFEIRKRGTKWPRHKQGKMRART